MSMATVMSQMPDVWRRVLAEHVPDQARRCRACCSLAGEHASWPCQTVKVAHEARALAQGELPVRPQRPAPPRPRDARPYEPAPSWDSGPWPVEPRRETVPGAHGHDPLAPTHRWSTPRRHDPAPWDTALWQPAPWDTAPFGDDGRYSIP